MGMKILITGGQGFIGRNLIQMLSTRKNISKIIVIDSKRVDDSYAELFKSYSCHTKISNYKKDYKKINFIKCSTNNLNFAMKITKNIDYVIHLAAESGVDVSINKPYDSFLSNIVGTYNYLEASRVNNVKNFIFASSGAVFGKATPPMKHDYPKCPISPYGSSKLTIESYCSSYSSIFNLPTTILRFSNAYGEFSKHKNSIISKVIKSYLFNQRINIFGDGKHSRDFIYVKDICYSIIKCLRKRSGYNEYHIGTGKEITLNKLLDIINKEFRKHGIKQPRIKYLKERMGDMKNNSLDITQTKRNLNWRPIFNLQKGLNSTIAWYLRETVSGCRAADKIDKKNK
tara:strand:+ start:2273 stop:3301 length:1029 start_codon:yes stop_codon:yes gene_type:complete